MDEAYRWARVEGAPRLLEALRKRNAEISPHDEHLVVDALAAAYREGRITAPGHKTSSIY